MCLIPFRVFILPKCKAFVCFLLAFSIALPISAKTGDKPYLYSDWSAGVQVGYQQALKTEWLELSLANAPWQDSGLMGSLSYGYGATAEMGDNSSSQLHRFSELKLGLGYQWFFEHWQVVPQIKVVTPVSKLPELEEPNQVQFPDNGDIYGEIELATYYSINDRWRVMISVAQLSSDFEGINGTNVTLGINYRLGKVQHRQLNTPVEGRQTSMVPVSNQPSKMQRLVQKQIEASQRDRSRINPKPTQPHAILSAAPVVLETNKEFVESNQSGAVGRDLSGQFAVQVASFNDYRSIRPFVKKHKFDIANLSTIKRGRYERLLYGNYKTKKMANIIAEQFKLMGIDCIVVAVDFSQVSDYVQGN